MNCRTTVLAILVSYLSLSAAAWAGEPSFHNDVMAVLSKSGCNLGTCHGNARGKGGFQLSLRGQDPDADFSILTRDLHGRRVNPIEPDHSLLLLKPTMKLAHEGGKRFDSDSPEYRALRDWIAADMPNDPAGSSRLVQLRVTPDELFLPGEVDKTSREGSSNWRFQIRATAEFSDGTLRDVTSLAVYEVAQPIVDVSHDGFVSGRSAGETTVLVRYLNLQMPVRMAFVVSRPDFIWSAPPTALPSCAMWPTAWSLISGPPSIRMSGDCAIRTATISDATPTTTPGCQSLRRTRSASCSWAIPSPTFGA